MRLNDLYPFPEERKGRKRVGRGAGSGLGGTSGKGHKGQNARSGGGVRPGFEGGQMPLQRRLPKRGFKDIYSRGLVKSALVKILGEGEVTRPVSIEAFRFSQSAKDKILAAGGEVKELLADEEPATSEE